MATFAKDLLYPGTYTLRDGRKVTYAKGDVPKLAARMTEMIAAGLHIPLSWNHQKDAFPYYSADAAAARAKHNLGFALKAEVAPEGFLAGTLDVPLEEDAKRLPAVRFVSPRIEENFTDSTGKVWPGPSITHIALTPRPVQHGQKPFADPVNLAVELSLDGFLSEDFPPNETPDEKKTEKKEEKSGDSKTKEDDKMDEAIPDLGSLENLLKELQDTCQLVLPQDTTVETLIERLMTAVLTKKAHQEKDGPDEEQDPYPGTEPPAQATPPAVQMSQDTPVAKWLRRRLARRLTAMVKKQIRPTPGVKVALLSMDQPGNRKLRDFATRDVKDRLGKILPVIGRQRHDAMLEQLVASPVELSEDGELLEHGTVADLSAYERLLKARPKFFEASLGFEDAEPVEPPTPTAGPTATPAQVDKIVADFLEMSAKT